MVASLLDRPRAQLAKAVRDRIAGNEFDEIHERIWNSPGPRWFTESDAIWRVHADTAMFVGGMRALLLQSLHPVAMQGVSEHSDFRTDPWGRLQRTSKFLSTTTYGTVADAERSIAIVRAIHRRVTGTAPTGRAYRADDPDLLLWIHLAEIDSFLSSHQHFGAERLNDADADEYVAQTASVAERLGAVGAPRSVAELADQIAGYRPQLAATAPAFETVELLLTNPPLDGPAKLAYQVLAQGAVSILPPWARTTLGLTVNSGRDRLVSRPLTRTAMRTLRWALTDGTAV